MELAETGSTHAVEGIRIALAHSDWSVRNYALMGISRALEKQRASPVFKDQLLAPVVNLFSHSFTRGDRSRPFESKNACIKAAELLLLFNRDAVIASLLEPSLLHRYHADLGLILGVLNDLGVLVHENLHAWLSEFRVNALKEEYSDETGYGEILVNLGLQRDSALPDLVHDVEVNFSYYGDIQCSAAKAMCYACGLPPNFHWLVMDFYYAYPADQRNQLPLSVRYLVAAMEMETWMSCGIEQYIEQAGSDVKFMIECMIAMQDAFTVWKLQKVEEIFGLQGIPESFEERLTRMHERGGYIFDAIMKMEPPTNLKCRDLKVLYFQFAAKNAGELGEFIKISKQASHGGKSL